MRWTEVAGKVVENGALSRRRFGHPDLSFCHQGCTMASHTTTDRESADFKKVDAAIQALVSGDLDRAEQLLLAVIANTPPDYSNFEDGGDSVSIRFWDQTAFLHYVMWQQDKGLANKNITWIGNAYPRAHYYMGFLCVKRKQFDRAIEFLDKGRRLEPTNPMFAFEKAQALVHSGRRKEALALYDGVTEIGPHVSARDVAVARRGRGSVLIEMGDLDGAETAFNASLEIEPDSEVALNELCYIDDLRRGGRATSMEAVPSSGPNLSRCAVCGERFNKGVVVSVDGMPTSICRRCEGKLGKKWWQFWK
jgi:tetratricopeptide (TPR) repeat protein